MRAALTNVGATYVRRRTELAKIFEHAANLAGCAPLAVARTASPPETVFVPVLADLPRPLLELMSASGKADVPAPYPATELPIVRQREQLDSWENEGGKPAPARSAVDGPGQ